MNTLFLFFINKKFNSLNWLLSLEFVIEKTSIASEEILKKCFKKCSINQGYLMLNISNIKINIVYSMLKISNI